MSFSLKWGSLEEPDKSSGLIYFDAISVFTQDYKGQVTKHPIDSGSMISDHFIKENPVFGLSGVISGTDISTFTNLIRDLEGNIPYNAYDLTEAVSINSKESDLFKLVPDVIGQFFQPELPEVTIGIDRTIVTDQVRDGLISLMSGINYNEARNKFESNVQLVQLYEYTGIVISRITSNLVLTTLRFKEDTATGDGLYFDMVLEQVSFVQIKKGQLPKYLAEPLKKKATTEQKKGTQDSTSNPVESDDPDSPKADSLSGVVNGDNGFGIGQPLP
jgi:hypothetical protein